MHAGKSEENICQGQSKKKRRKSQFPTCEDLLFRAIELFEVEGERNLQAKGQKLNLVTEYYNKHLPKDFPQKTKIQLMESVKTEKKRAKRELEV